MLQARRTFFFLAKDNCPGVNWGSSRDAYYDYGTYCAWDDGDWKCDAEIIIAKCEQMKWEVRNEKWPAWWKTLITYSLPGGYLFYLNNIMGKWQITRFATMSSFLANWLSIVTSLFSFFLFFFLSRFLFAPVRRSSVSFFGDDQEKYSTDAIVEDETNLVRTQSRTVICRYSKRSHEH